MRVPHLGELLSVIAPPLCWGCGGLAAGGSPLCRPCGAALRLLPPETVAAGGVEAWAPVAYEGPARTLVGALKFRGAAGVADAMAAQIVARAPPELLEHAVLVPVPLHASRLRRRGFNQAQALAAAISTRTGLSLRECLVRAGSPVPQTGRPRAERLLAARGTVRLAPGTPAPGKALLVDDVITTGATVGACASGLRRGGAEQVAAVAYARTPPR